LHFTEVLYSNPDRKTQRENLPYNAEYPSSDCQKRRVLSHINALIGTREDELLW
jgi:hypothetical protein